jgi:glycosyltransferase 2 family protein
VAVNKKQRKIKYSIITSILLSVIFIFIVLYFTFTDFSSFKHQLNLINFRYEFFVIAVSLNFVSWCLWGLRLKTLANTADSSVNVSWWNSTKIVMANHFLAGITPSMAGGEPVRIHLLKKEGMSIGGSTASVIGERVLDVVVVLICLPFAFFIFKDSLAKYAINHSINTSLLSVALTIGIIIFLIVIFLFFHTIKFPDKTKMALIWIAKKFSRFLKNKEKKSKIIDRINCETDNFHSSIMIFLKGKKSTFFYAGVLTTFMWICSWLIPSFILMGLGLKPFFIESISIQIFLIIIVMMPTTPGGAGITEGSIGLLYSVIIGTGAVLGVFVILFRCITYYMNLIFGAIFMQRIFKSVANFSMDSIKKTE